MADVVVVGAGVGGLGAALALAGQGHRLTVVERDRTPMPANPDEAFAWDRRGAPQVRHSHALLARLRNLLRDRYPDVLSALFDAGVTDWPLTANLPETLDDRTAKPGDEDLVMLAGRRTTFEWVLRRCTLDSAGVRFLDGTVVEGLTGTKGSGMVTGARTSRGNLPADVVVMATGRRGDVPAWLGELGIGIPEEVEDTGIVYLSRFYRLRPGADVPPSSGPIGGDLGYLKYATFVGDNRTFSVTFASPVGDDELRARLLDVEGFERAARVLTATRPWVEHDRAEPLTGVHVMARLLNRRRRFADGDGAPSVIGLHAVGDSHTCTNPLYGRGCALAMVQATLLADAMAAHPGDGADRAAAYEAASRREIDPWYEAAVAQDREARRAALVARGEEAAPEGDDPRAFLAAVMRDGLLPAMRLDHVVFRAFLRTFNLLTTPDALIRDSDVVNRVLAVFNDPSRRPPDVALGPADREDFLQALCSASGA